MKYVCDVCGWEYCLNGSVIDLEVSDFQQRHYFSTSSSLSPKYAFCTCGSF